MRTRLTILLFVLLQGLDVVTTFIGLTYFPGEELNGHIAFLIARLGVLNGLLLVKGFGLAFAGVIAMVRPRALWKINVVFVLVVGWNLFQILRYTS